MDAERPRISTGCKIGSWNACSISNKSSTIQEHIVSNKLDIFAIVETSHESLNSPSLIASMPAYYTCLEKARPPPPGVLNPRGPRGGGVCIIYKEHLTASMRDLGSFSTFEYLAAYFTFRNLHSLIIVIYRPGSENLNGDFFTEFSNLLTATLKYSCHIIILGDLNIHLDELNNPNTKRFSKLLVTHELIQHVMVPTQTHGHTLDVIITRDDNLLVSNIDIAPPSTSDHSIIHFNIAHQLPPIIRQSVERRSFVKFDPEAFKSDLESTDIFKQTLLMENFNSDADSLFDLYDSTMQNLLDKHAPMRKITIRKVPDCPWFDGACATSKKLTRRLERQYLKSPSEEREHHWRTQIKVQRKLFQQKRTTYFKDIIESAQGNGRTLWKSFNTLLTPPQDSSSHISPDTLLDYFEKKIDLIRESTKDTPMPDFSTLPPL